LISLRPTLSPKNPSQVGVANESNGPLDERRFLNAFAGPNGVPVTYYRLGRCCPIKIYNYPFGFGEVLLDNYRVTWEGSSDTVSILINLYDEGPMKAPQGFNIKK